ncbi:methyl-accepting chemotaxis protein [Litoribrevibacter euphylliae]|uniref:Methyl-accepting chemotaxis protein n=1 Tax=Litoribrevibacter euphylliae TaxID=1834034 RepID=A0ABV7HI09_9GAMM
MRVSIFLKSQLTNLAFLIILFCSFGWLMMQMNEVVSRIEHTQEFLEEQNVAIAEQKSLLNHQKEKMDLQAVTLSAYSNYSRYLTWRLESAISTDSRSIEEANEAEQKLRTDLNKIIELDEELGEAADVVAIYLEDFNSTIQEAIELNKSGAEARLIRSKVGESQSHSSAMNAMFETILEQAALSVNEASEGVFSAGVKVEDSITKVQTASQKNIDDGNAMETKMIYIFVLASIISVVIGVLVAKSVTRPIRLLTQQVKDIEQESDLTRRININSRDEISDIASAVNSMLATFQTIIQQLMKESDQLATASQQSKRLSDQNLEIVEQLKAQSEMVATASNEMAITIKGINDHTEEAVNQSDDATRHCQQTENIIQATANNISTLSNQVEDTVQSISEVAKNSQAIGSVLDVIRGIAEQTNLLALNAAIEAARAGEQGRGFAVVADEVRALAQKTGDSTNEIQAMIETLQKGVTGAVSEMERSKDQVQTSLEESQKANDTIQATVTAVATIAETNQQIAHSTEEQATAAESIDESITSISQLSDGVASSAESAAHSSEELERIVVHMNQIINKFKVNG